MNTFRPIHIIINVRISIKTVFIPHPFSFSLPFPFLCPLFFFLPFSFSLFFLSFHSLFPSPSFLSFPFFPFLSPFFHFQIYFFHSRFLVLGGEGESAPLTPHWLCFCQVNCFLWHVYIPIIPSTYLTKTWETNNLYNISVSIYINYVSFFNYFLADCLPDFTHMEVSPHWINEPQSRLVMANSKCCSLPLRHPRSCRNHMLGAYM